jgi:phytoene synthase
VTDSPGEPATKAEALGRWREELARCYAGEPRHPITAELLPAIRRYNLPREHFEGILDGVGSDLTCRRYESFEDLRQYCHRVASLVGLLCVEVFGYRDPGSRDYARELGLAFQLTNILRDIGADAGAGRIYLPREDLARFGVGEGDILSGRLTAAFRDLMAFQVARARERYALAESLLPRADRRDLFAARIMAGIYQRILSEIERMGYDVFRRQAGIGTARKIGIALKVYLSDRALSSPG